MEGKNKVIVKVGGKEYALLGVESEEYIQRVALYVNRKMVEIMNSSNTLSTASGAVLASLNIGDEYMKERDKNEKLEFEVADLLDRANRYKEESESLRKENVMLREKSENFKMELVKREAELKEVRNNINRR